MREQIQTLVTMLQSKEPFDNKIFLTLLLDVMAAQAMIIEELEKNQRRVKESVEVLARGGKPVSQPGAPSGSGFSIG